VDQLRLVGICKYFFVIKDYLIQQYNLFLMNGQVCMPMFYFSLLIVSLIAAIIWGGYQLLINNQGQFYPMASQPSPQIINPYQPTPSSSSSSSPPSSPPPSFSPPPPSPDQADDLALGERPPRRRDYRKLNDPLKEPSRRYVRYPDGRIPAGNINIPTQGYLPSYQSMGYLRRSGKGEQDPDRMLRLFGRRTDTHNYQYYTTHHDDPSLKIPLDRKGDRELFEGDKIKVPGYPGEYQVSLYDFEAPKYIPYL